MEGGLPEGIELQHSLGGIEVDRPGDVKVRVVEACVNPVRQPGRREIGIDHGYARIDFRHTYVEALGEGQGRGVEACLQDDVVGDDGNREFHSYAGGTGFYAERKPLEGLLRPGCGRESEQGG